MAIQVGAWTVLDTVPIMRTRGIGTRSEVDAPLRMVMHKHPCWVGGLCRLPTRNARGERINLTLRWKAYCEFDQGTLVRSLTGRVIRDKRTLVSTLACVAATAGSIIGTLRRAIEGLRSSRDAELVAFRVGHDDVMADEFL